MESDKFLIAGKHYLSRLLVGTGKYKDFKETQTAISESGAEIVTVAIRRTNIGQNIKEEFNYKAVNNMLIDWELYENGWFVSGDRNNRLWNHLCQLGDAGYYKVTEVSYLK